MASKRTQLITAVAFLILCQVWTGGLSQTQNPASLTLLTWSVKNASVHRLATAIGDPSVWSAGGSTPLIMTINLPENGFVTHFSFDYVDDKGFYVDIGGYDIGRHVGHIPITQANLMNPDLLSAPLVDYIGMSEDVGGLAVDWVANNVYWTDSVYNWIAMAPMAKPSEEVHGSNKTAVVISNNSPREFGGIAVYPQKGYMYWASYNSSGTIERATLSGAERITLAKFNITKPRGLTLDYATEQLYWVDAARGTVEAMKIDGSARRTVYSEPGSKLYDIAAYKQFLYVTDQNSNVTIVLRNDSVNPSAYVMKLNTSVTPYAIGVYAPDVQQAGTSSCPQRGCDHMCVSQPMGATRCLCAVGWTQNGTSCTANSTIIKPNFFYSGGSYIQTYPFNFADRLPADISYHSQNDIIQGSIFSYHNFQALGLDVKGSKLFLGDTSYRSIYTLNLIRPESDLIQIIAGVNGVGGLAIDWLNSHIYWTEKVYKTLQVAKLDGGRQTILKTNLSSPGSVVVDPLRGLMYWVETYDLTYSTIWKANMDGSGQSIFYNTSLGRVNDIHFDFSDQRMYWTDGTTDTIMSADVNGNNVALIYNTTRKELFGVTTFKNYVIFNDRYSGAMGIHAVTKTGQTLVKGIVRSGSYHDALDVITYDDSVQPPSGNVRLPCSLANGGCDHLCLPTPILGFKCACSVGFSLTGSTSCTTTLLQDNFVLLTDPGRKEIFQIALDGSSYNAVKLGSDHDYPRAVIFDSAESKILWMDTDVIKSVGLDGSAEETLYEFPQAAILQRMALDVSNRLLFVTDDGRTLIGVLDLVGKNFKTVIDSRLYRPRDIEIDPWENRIYWADWGATESINRAYYDGSEREEIVTSYLYFPFGLAIDVPGRKIMWAEGWYEEIEASNLDGSNRDTIYIKRSSFFHGLAISDSNLYFTDTWTRSLHKIPIAGAADRADEELIPGVLGSAIDLHVVQRAKEYKPKAVCGNHPCSHICLINKDNGTQCACPDGATLKDDGINCDNVASCPKSPIKNGLWSPACVYRAGLVCDFLCDTGYRKRNSTQLLTCGSNEQWDADDFNTLCEEIPLECPIPVVRNGKLQDGCGITKGASCLVVCDTGYGTHPASLYTTCTADLVWSRDLSSVCVDTEPPNVTCPRDVTISADAGRMFGAVTWPAPVVKDASDVTLSSNFRSGGQFGIGTTNVVFSARDAYGNFGSCSFNVLVTATTVHCPSPTIPHGEIGPGCNMEAGSSCRVTCERGYSTDHVNITCLWSKEWSSVSRSICRDTSPPTVSNCPANITEAAPTGSRQKRITWIEPTFNDSPPIKIVKSFMPGTIFGEGKTDVIYVATDSAGNVARCTFSVTITVEKCNPYIGTSTVQTLRDQTCPSTNNHLGASCYFTCMEGYATKDGQVQGYFECAKTMSVSTKMAQWRNSIGACELIPTKSPVISSGTDKQTGGNNAGGNGAASGATPAIVGIVVAALLILIVIGVVAFFLWRRMSRGDLSKPSQFRYVNHSNEISEIPGDPNYATIGAPYRVNQPENDYEGLNTAQANGDGGIANPMYDQMNPPPTKKPGEFDDLSQQAVLKVQSDTTKA